MDPFGTHIDMEQRPFGGGRVGTVLRLVSNAGANKDNYGTIYGDSAFIGIDVIEAMHKIAPHWGICGVIKHNNKRDVPFDFLKNLIKSRHGAVVRGGQSHFMVSTLPCGKTALCIIHAYSEGRR